jgi:uncharacterized membrane protein (UPF0136 family)
MITFARIVLLLYALALIAGGIMGYVKAGSQASLISGGASGAAGIVAFLVSFKRPRLGLAIGFAVAAAVGYMMYRRYTEPGDSPKELPLRIAIASAVTVVILLAGLLFGRRRERA